MTVNIREFASFSPSGIYRASLGIGLQILKYFWKSSLMLNLKGIPYWKVHFREW